MIKTPVALITGGSRGIGKGIALSLANAGYDLIINHVSPANVALADTVAEITQLGHKCVAVRADVATAQGRNTLLTTTQKTYGRCDLLVNNAGVAPKTRIDLLETTEESYEYVMDINLKGPFFLTQCFANWMIAQLNDGDVQKCRIINIGSISAYTSSPARGEYCLSKAGMGMMTQLYADRLSEYGIGVYELRPGIIATDMTSGVKDKYDKLIDDGLTPIKRWGTPSDIGKAVVAIGHGHFDFSTGEVINIDGGFHLKRL